MRDPVVELPGKKEVSPAGDVRESRGVLGLALVELVAGGGGAAEQRTAGTSRQVIHPSCQAWGQPVRQGREARGPRRPRDRPGPGGPVPRQ